jgi:hypothetical protein
VKTNKVERALGIHDSNVGQISAALTSAKCDVQATLTDEVRAFLFTLAKNSILIAATHDAEAKAKRKPRAPKEDKVEKAPKKPRKSALAAAAAEAAEAVDA